MPYRPEHTDSKPAESKCSQCKSSACKDAECKHADFQSSDVQCAGHAVYSVGKVRQAGGESSTQRSSVRLAAVEDDNAAPVLNDPFNDNQTSSSYQHQISITPEDVDSTPAQREPAPLHPQRVAQRVPAEPRELPGESVKVYQTRPPASPRPDSYSGPAEQLPDLEGTRQALQNPAEDCRAAYDKLRNSTLDKVSLDITVPGKPGDDVPYECALTTDQFMPRCWEMTCYTWKSSCLCHKPLYFEEEALERYGHSHGWICEDLVSCAHFFGNVALLPYHVGVETPCECIYDLGVYRVGDCAPYILDPFPISLRGCCTAAVGYGAVVALFP